MRGFVVLLFALLLSGCSIQKSMDASRAQEELVGMSRGDLLACAGAPNTTAANGDTEYLTYSAVGGLTSTGRGLRDCKATFVLQGGRVARVNYTGNTGGLITQGKECEPIIRNCIR